MAHIRNLFNVLVYTNAIIAAAAVAQCALTYLILTIPYNPYVLLIEGSSTLLLYNFSLFLSKPRFPHESPYERTRWFFNHSKWMWALSGLAAVALSYALFHVSVQTLTYLGLIGVLSLLYHLPLPNKNMRTGGFRQIPGLKLFYIAIIWSLSTVGLPTIEAWTNGYTIDWLKANYLGLIKIIFIALCTLPFDIRDIRQDLHYKLRTIPTQIGAHRAVQLTYLLLSAHTLVVVGAPYPWRISFGLLATNILIVILLRFVIFRSEHIRYNQVYLLDLSLSIQYLFVLMFV